jgi:hypothetical protein
MSLQLNLVEILKNNLDSTFLEFELTLAELEYIQHFLHNDTILFSNLVDAINNIISDGIINYHDIPQLIIVFHELFTTHIVENEIKSVRLINIIRFICDSIFDSKILPIPEFEMQVIRKMVDSSLKLLSINSRIMEKKIENNSDICYIYTWIFGQKK